ncbi:General transcription factor II-I repeat domain-containing protein 2 [Blattella germanica]|nr:General transcription factor II-I repeat domain-containing protein 2 [Blattella germanica]
MKIDFKDIQDAALHKELIELRCDRRLRGKFMNSSGTELIEFCRTLPDSPFPNLMRNAAKTIAMFLRTYLCGQAFSVMKLTKTQHRARISDNNLRNSLHIHLL